MPLPPYTRVTERFRAYGIDLNSPVDSVRPGFYPVLENVRSYTDGIIQPRQGLSSGANVVTNKTPVHSVRRIQDPLNSTWGRIIGAGDALAYGQGPYTQAVYNASNVTYDGNPLMMVPYRPDQAVVPFMYVASQVGHNVGSGVLRQLKINRTGTVHQWGLQPPLNPPVIEIGSNKGWMGNNVIAQADINAMTASVPGGVPGTATIKRIDNATVTVTARVYDSGTTGWVSVIPTSLVDIGVGMIIQDVNNVEYFRVCEVYTGSSATTIAAINYNTGTTGACSIVPVNPSPEIKRNAVVKIGANYFRITSVITGSDSSVAVRIDTGATAVVSGNTFQLVGSFRCLSGVTIANGDQLESDARDAAFTVSGADSFGYFVSQVTRDLTRIPSGDGLFVSTGFQFDDEDYFHVSIWCDNWSKLVSGRVVFNVDPAENPSWTTAVPYSLSKNFYYRAFSPNDFTPESQNTQTAIDNSTSATGRSVIDHAGEPNGRPQKLGVRFLRDRADPADPTMGDPSNPVIGPGEDLTPATPRSQTGTGSSQWSEVRFKKGDCVRVGNKSNGDWSACRHIVFEFVVNGACHIRVNSMSAWGGFRPDIGDLGSPYQYRYRYRVSSTGVKSNWSPPALNGVMALRQQATVTIAQPTNTPEVDKVDIQRWGGALTNWTYIGTTPVGSFTFTDNSGDQDIVANVLFSDGDTNYQPWVSRGAPVSGTSATSTGSTAGVAGNTLRDSGTSFNQSWAKGTAIIVNGVSTAIRRVISTSLMEIDDSLGSQSAVTWEIPEPLITGLPLPTVWTSEDRGFAVGDINNPGTLYFTNGNDIDGTQDTFFLEITNPSEPLVNGCAFNGKNYVWSTERMFEIENIGQNNFIAVEIPGRKGLISKYGIATGERIWFVSRDGIYQTGGGDSVSITSDTLKPLFALEGAPGQSINGFLPPSLTLPNNIRLSYYKGYLYFIYKDTGGTLRCLTYSVHSEKPGWWPDIYQGLGVTYIYGEEGFDSDTLSLMACASNATTGKIYKISGTSDDGNSIACHLRTQYYDGQDRRAEKRWGDFILDADPNNTFLNVIAYTNGVTTSTLSLSPTSMTGAARTQQIFDISSGADPEADFARSMALDISWNSQLTPLLYLWEPSYAIRPEKTALRGTLWDTCGHEGDKFFQGIEVYANTQNTSRTVNIEYDGLSTNVAETITMQHNGAIQKAYPFHPAFIAHTVRARPTDSSTWEPYSIRWIWQPEPPLADRWESQQTSFGNDDFLHMKAAWVTLRSNSVVTLTVTRTDDSTSKVYTIASTGNARQKVYVPFEVFKGKAFIFVFTSGTAFRLYKDDTTVLMKPWASEDSFVNRNVFGMSHGRGEAPI